VDEELDMGSTGESDDFPTLGFYLTVKSVG